MFCRHYLMTRERQYPSGDYLYAFYRHLIFDDPHKVIYCFVPKVHVSYMYMIHVANTVHFITTYTLPQVLGTRPGLGLAEVDVHVHITESVLLRN